jgi:hypothetical protein
LSGWSDERGCWLVCERGAGIFLTATTAASGIRWWTLGFSAVSDVLTQEEPFLFFERGWSKVTTVQIARHYSGSKSTLWTTSNLSGRSFCSCEVCLGRDLASSGRASIRCRSADGGRNLFLWRLFLWRFLEGFPAFASGVEGESEQVHDGKDLGKVSAELVRQIHDRSQQAMARARELPRPPHSSRIARSAIAPALRRAPVFRTAIPAPESSAASRQNTRPVRWSLRPPRLRPV